MQEEFYKYFHLDEVDHQELPHVMLAFFNYGGETEEGFKFQRQGENEFVEFVTNLNDERIEKIILSGNFPKGELVKIEQKIKEQLLENQLVKIAQEICFSNVPVKGGYRYGNQFQIIPVPENAPKPHFSASEDHPFLLQHKYTSSSEIWVNNRRREGKAVYYTRILNLLLNRRIRHRSYMMENFWGMIKRDNQFNYEYIQEGYGYDGYQWMLNNFTDLSSLPKISEENVEEYYGVSGVGAGDVLTIPTNLEESLNLIFSLDKDRFNILYRALSWYNQAQNIWRDSRSSYFIALVAAIECLTEKPDQCRLGGHAITKSLDKCLHCGEPLFRITKKFIECLEKYAPFLNDYPRERNLIYDTRSKLAHGLELLKYDLYPMNSHFNKRAFEEDRRIRNLDKITKFVILNSLKDQKLE